MWKLLEPGSTAASTSGTELRGGLMRASAGERAVGAGLTRDARMRQVEKEEPQPHVVVAFGLRMTNWAPSRPSR